MTDIEKTHPSIKLKIRTGLYTLERDCDNTPVYSMWTMERLLEDIQKTTIDKQVLRDVLLKEKSQLEDCDGIIVNKKHYEYGKEETHNEYCVAINFQLEFIKRLLKELKLEEQ